MLKGDNQMSFLWHSQGFIVISHILSNTLEINIYYLIIDSNVFGVKLVAIFLFFLVLLTNFMYNKYHYISS
jgi:hypothetical protein